MADGAVIASRFLLYLDLMLLFGVAAYPLYARGQTPVFRTGPAMATLAIVGLFLSAWAFLLMVAAMSGVQLLDLDAGTLRFVISDTVPGAAFLIRSAVLSAAALALVAGFSRPWIVAILAAIALASLAWTGHAAATEGAAGLFHRAADSLHLLAAAAWLGALAMLLKAVGAQMPDEAAVAFARHALTHFSRIGSVLVIVLLITGLANVLMILGPAGVLTLPQTLYGRLLGAKLLLFLAMLGFAAINRWRLTPILAAAQAGRGAADPVRALRVSIGLEAAAATIILGIVAWLGTLDPL